MKRSKKRIQVEVRPGKVWMWAPCGPSSAWMITVGGVFYGWSYTKPMAVAEGREACLMLSGRGRACELAIKGRNGRIQDRRTYPRSSDPRRSKG